MVDGQLPPGGSEAPVDPTVAPVAAEVDLQDLTPAAVTETDLPAGALDPESLLEAPDAEVAETTGPVTEVVPEAVETNEAGFDREKVLAKIDETQRALDELRATFEGVAAEDPLKDSLPQETAPVEPEVAQASAQIAQEQHASDQADETPQIITRGQVPVAPQPDTAEQPAPEPIEVPEDLQAHPQPELTVVPDLITQSDIPGDVPSAVEPVPAPTMIIDKSDVPSGQAPAAPVEPTGDSNEHSFIRDAVQPAPAAPDATPGDQGNV